MKPTHELGEILRAAAAIFDFTPNSPVLGFNKIIRDLVKRISKQLFGKIAGGEGGGLLGSGFDWLKTLILNASGGVYESPGLSAYSGSIVTRPTLFAKGAGLMGEAGAEAILPLMRNAEGKLGVSAGGQAGPTINVYVTGTDAPDVRRAAGQGARQALSALSGAKRYS